MNFYLFILYISNVLIFSGIFFILFSEFNLLLSIIYLEISFMTLSFMLAFIGFYADMFYPFAFSIVLLALAGGDSVLAISFLIYLNRAGQNDSSLSYLKSIQR